MWIINLSSGKVYKVLDISVVHFPKIIKERLDLGDNFFVYAANCLKMTKAFSTL